MVNGFVDICFDKITRNFMCKRLKQKKIEVHVYIN